MTEQIIAIGGGGFSTQSEPELDAYILAQANAARPRIGFIATASGDSDSYLTRFYARFSALDCRPSHLGLFDRTPDIAGWVGNQDIIFVGGGNTKSMLAVWYEWDLVRHLRLALAEGVVLSGVSAGAICWFEFGVTDSSAGELRPLSCLGILAGSCCPHYSDDVDRRPAYERMVASGDIAPGIAIDDGAGVHFIDGVPSKVVSARGDATAYRVSSKDAVIMETPIPEAQMIRVGG